MVTINLLDSRRKDILKRQAQAAKFNGLGLVAAVLMALVSVGVGGYRLQLSTQMNQLEDEVKRKQSQIGQYQQVITDSELVSDKLNVVETILMGRDLVRQKLALFFKIFSEEKVSVRQVGFGGTNNRSDLEIGGAVQNVSDYIDFSAQMDGYVTEDNLETVLIDSLNRLEEGDYRFNYIIRFSAEE